MSDIPPERREHDEGTLTLESPLPGIFVSDTLGYMRQSDAEQFARYGDTIIQRHGSLWGFHDWTALMGFSQATAVFITQWSVRNVKNFNEVHIAVNTPLVKSAVMVGTLALRGKIYIHDTLESLAEAKARTNHH